jgi:cytochrome c peroxidase
LTLFLGNLAPVPWDKIELAWLEPYRGAESTQGAFARLDVSSDVATEPLREAIVREDRQAVFRAATRLIAMRVEEELDSVFTANSPSEAQQALSAARELFRAFSDHISAADPDGARQLGRSWLELTSAAGSSGVLNAGEVPQDRVAMQRAREVISKYLADNYLLDAMKPRQKLSAIPETASYPANLPATLPPGTDIFNQEPLPLLVLNFEEQGIDETDLPLIAYGDMLFDSPEIFSGPAQANGITCSTCHNRSDINQRLFIPGLSHQPGAVDVDNALFNPMFNDRRNDPIDIPSLRGLRFTGPYGRDGRFASLRDFTRNVIVNEFAGAEPTPYMLDALVAYMTEFDFLPNALLGSDGQLTDAASDTARRGEVVFNRTYKGLGNRSCASCHVPDGNFLDRQAHNIGSVEQPYQGARTGALDTPTLLGIAHTAPYFHDGSLPTLASVVNWFNRSKELGMTKTERAELTAYLEAVGAADEPYEVFDAENTPFRLAFSELTTFASTLDVLLPLQDEKHIMLLVDTVATDLAADAGTMVNQAARPEVYSLAERLVAIGSAVRADDWVLAQAHWFEFQTEAQAIKEKAF